MALIGVGGDTSVVWNVDADSTRPGSVHSEPVPGVKPNKHHQDGTDETPDGRQVFTVSIEIPTVPADRTAFAAALQRAADDAKVLTAKARVSFDLPIEDNKYGGPNEDQIQITWPSR